MFPLAIPSHYGAMPTSSGELTGLVTGPYQLVATFACVMLLSTFLLVVFMRPGTMGRIVAGVPFSLFILALISIIVQEATGCRLINFSMADTPSPLLSTLRLAAELLCYLAAWKCMPWLYVGKEALIAFAVRLLTRR